MNLLKLKKLANSGHFDDLAQIWPEALADDDTDRDELLRIVAQVRRLGADEHADKLLSSLLSLHEEEGGKRARLDACRDAAVVMPRSEMVRKELRTLYNTVHKDNEQVSELTGRLLADGEALDKAVPTLDRFLQLTPGRFFTDRGHLEPGMVLTVDGGRARLDVTFGGRSATLDRAAVDAVIILPEDHFPSMLLYKQEELKAMADQDPEAFVLSAVRATRDRMCSYKDLRKHHAAPGRGRLGQVVEDRASGAQGVQQAGAERRLPAHLPHAAPRAHLRAAPARAVRVAEGGGRQAALRAGLPG